MKTIGLANLTADPQLRSVQVGEPPEQRSVCEMRVAMKGTRGRGDGFVDVVAWGRLAETCAEHLTKGREIYLEGRLSWRDYTAEDGSKRERYAILAEEIQFLRGGQPGDSSPAPEASEPGTVPTGSGGEDIPF